MSKKSVAMIVVGVAVVFFILGASFFQSDNETNKEVSESENERENNDFLGFNKEDLKTKNEIADIIDQYKSEEDLSDEDIALKLDEDHGETIGNMYRRGLMIDDDFSKEDNQQILANYIFIENLSNDDVGYPLKDAKPIKEISNPIEQEFDNEEENKFLSVSDLIFSSYDVKNYVKDTEGFYEVEGLNLGYPSVDSEFYKVKDGEIVVRVLLLTYIDETLDKKEAEEFFNKYEDVEVNGKTLEEDRYVYFIKDDLMKGFDNNEYVFYEGTVIKTIIECKLNDLFDHDFETFKAEDELSLTEEDMEKAEEEMNKAFGLDEESIEEVPSIKINGKNINIDDYIIKRGIEGSDEDEYENDFSLSPEVK